ncbi:NADH:ubiquinone reductase (Na(+)-transporting) subunit F [Candidatus Hydrogenedentota bacterium]
MFSIFLVSVGTACGLTTFLALLMVIADATIANYGEVKLTVNGERELTVEGGASLLSTLKNEKIFIPSACGGRGSCGLCKVKVLDGAGGLLPTELPWLDDEERKNNVRLSCQIKVKQDMAIQIPEELFSVKEFQTEVASIVDLTYDTKQIRLKLVEPSEIDLISGQFVQFVAPEYEMSDEPVYRAYSVASQPSRKNEIELEVRLVPNGICTTFIHEYLAEGDTVTVNGPYGDFHLSDTDKDIIFIAGGSGMAPIKAILHDMLEKGIHRRVRYFFGGRALKDLFLIEEMRDLEKKLPDFKFVPALSEPSPDDDWNGETGLITEVVGKYVGSAEDKEAYLCGSPGMIDACIEVLTRKGMSEELIFYDKFA